MDNSSIYFYVILTASVPVVKNSAMINKHKSFESIMTLTFNSFSKHNCILKPCLKLYIWSAYTLIIGQYYALRAVEYIITNANTCIYSLVQLTSFQLILTQMKQVWITLTKYDDSLLETIQVYVYIHVYMCIWKHILTFFRQQLTKTLTVRKCHRHTTKLH